ncbi:hypothetical protein BGY98DRAFT_915941, partial [Russula aff. rugulosa BPL654]
IHTFNALVLRNWPPHWLGTVIISTGWASAVILGVAPVSVTSNVNGPFYSIGSLTCDISKSYGVAHMLLYFLPLFIALFLSAIVYSLIFLMLRGTIAFNAGLEFQFNPERRSRTLNETAEECQRFIFSVARRMLCNLTCYLAFILALLPYSVIQLMEISGITVSPGAMALVCILERLDGVINVLILFSVIRTLSPSMKSSDSEKGHSGKAFISRPLDDSESLSTFLPRIQGQATKPATLQGGAKYVFPWQSLCSDLIRRLGVQVPPLSC